MTIYEIGIHLTGFFLKPMKDAVEFKPSITDMYPQFIFILANCISIPYIHPNKLGDPNSENFPRIAFLIYPF
jgi:hypothetical protein